MSGSRLGRRVEHQSIGSMVLYFCNTRDLMVFSYSFCEVCERDVTVVEIDCGKTENQKSVCI